MLTPELLQELVSYNSADQEVISLYLNADSSQQSTDAIKLQAKGLLKGVAQAQEADVDAISNYLDHAFDWSSPGLAIFSAVEGEFFRAYPVAVSFRNRLRVGRKPYVKPLAHFIDYYAHYGVILVDRLGARFFEYHLGELQMTDGFIGEDVRKIKKGSGSSAIGMRGGVGGGRHEDEVAHRNVREAAIAATAFFNHKAVRRLFLGGTIETVSLFRDMLPRQMQACLAGTFAIDMNASEHEVRQHTLHLLREANAERERQLVQELITRAAKGEQATVGLDSTLQAISDKRVQLLILSDGYRTPGYVQEEAGFVVANLTLSPLSVPELTDVSDVIDSAVTFTLAQGGRLEVIADNPDLEQIGQIGALLRY